jgi:lipopolysaccharide export system permease protein
MAACLPPILFRSIFREPRTATLLAWLGFTLIFVMAHLTALTDLLVNRGLSTETVLFIALYDALPAASQSLPFAVLIGAHVALGRLGADSELKALEASGVSLRRLAWPLGTFGALGAVCSLILTLSIAPWGHRQLDALWADEALRNPSALLKAGTLYQIGDWRLEAREVSARGDELEGIAIWAPELGEMLFAEHALIQQTEDGSAQVEMHNAVTLLKSQNDWIRRLHFERAFRDVPKPDERSLRLSDWSDSATMAELAQRAADASVPERSRLVGLAEWHRRVALPASALLFSLLALPLSTGRQRSSRSGGIAWGMLAAVTYYALTYLGTGLAAGGLISQGVSAWLPNAVVTLVLGVLLLRMAHPTPRERRLKKTSQSDTPAPTRIRSHNMVLLRFLTREFLGVAVLCFSALLLVLWVGDVLDNLKWFGRYQATPSEVVRYYGPRLIVLAVRVLPMSLLIAAALTITRLSLRGELIGMRSCGISATRIGMPVLVPCAVATLVCLALYAEVIPRAHAAATQIKRDEIKNGKSRSDGAADAVSWHRKGKRMIVTDFFDPVNGVAGGLQIYELDDRGLPSSRIDAVEAKHVGNGIWRLIEATKMESSDEGIRIVDAPPHATLGGVTPRATEADLLTFSELSVLIEELDQSGLSSLNYRVDRHGKLAWPFACLALPILGILLALRNTGSGGHARPLIWATALGVAHMLVSSFATSLGYNETLPPIAAAWSPLIALGIGAYLLARRGD